MPALTALERKNVRLQGPWDPSLNENYASYAKAGFPQKDLQHFNNVINASLIEYEDAIADTCVIHKVTPPAVHMMMGATEKIVGGLRGQFKEFDSWARDNHIFRRGYQGGGFDGVNCKKILDKVDKIPLNFLPFSNCLRSLSTVVSMCFGRELHCDWRESIV